MTACNIAPRLFHPDLFGEGLRNALVGNLQTLSVVLALFLSLLFAMATSGPPLHSDATAIFPQLYFCFVFNGIGISFYGLACTIIPLIFLQILDDVQTAEYLRLNGLGAVLTCITVVICINLGFALIVFGIALFGKPMGFACATNIVILFIGIYNKIRRHASWKAPVSAEKAKSIAKSIQVNGYEQRQCEASSLAADESNPTYPCVSIKSEAAYVIE
ncbi:hypothetical protein GUITHDRAFT_116431 [Guillardia theta CCMP2712]|uniref:Uncharacterized protein n=1 Tax=Guillardia theta (strain CCMP2712) TaxID=905079 RepID=L1IMZ4_GUITC|nr:hypothetical protein GUITHDRAFT_116431 [Guillardia theta CCMP2712]EKX37467.1 hypothetical protein GUITHDRAFT_116431 [Guillardia theta CCMP2712]|eukprot:XP_005824447.1 hypothetical protein GUITHDRAFT_116431 [Guillardia theta CCMP2712]